ncbi:coniferyl-alcohol dehydrogenase [Pseudomonas sp. B21-056]|jgi:NAD(P)-dependent dehydrogenase (short-subunit alcohol dehydrogenase family)|uniref:coniferyl-alcohol dehydrogenase n=1 Tax=Pseudomonas sp. B21-056 TaxID=2895495 RepID=UPI00222E3B29|nr:coniferyl-alcohol dehydrogenase [Pseudomonas sp. B21-056]UZE25917.1 coniferyl-alcohol dehydrogenase [Pseudomonas sp. B21-056]
MSFNDKRIVVTGASSGVGQATALALMNAGAFVIGLDVKPANDNCNQFILCDLSNPDSIDEAVLQIKQPINGLANIAGVPGSLPADVVFKVNFLGLRYLTNLLLPKLADKACVVNVASTAGAGWRNRKAVSTSLLTLGGWHQCLARFQELSMNAVATYDFTKELVILYTMLVASNQRHRGVRVNSVSPGAVCTPILADFYDTMGNELLQSLKQQAGGRDAYPDEIANAILLMLDPRGFWVNGTDLIVDGGAEVLMNLEGLAIPPLPFN